MLRFFFGLFLLLSACCGMVSCDHSPEKKTLIAVVPKVDDGTVLVARTAALAARGAYDIAVRWDVATAPTAEAQALLIGKLVQAGVQGLLISCVDTTVVVREAIDAAVAAGVKVATFDSDCPQSKRSFYIGSDNAAAGALAGITLRNLCTEAGRPATGIGVFAGARGDAAMVARLHGLVAQVPDTAALLWSGEVGTTGTQQVSSFLDTASFAVNGVMFLSSTGVEAGPGAITELDSLCRPVAEKGAAAAAVFFNLSENIRGFVQGKPHCAAIKQDYEAMVTGGIDRLLKLIGGGTVGETVIYTPVEVVR